MRMDWNRGAAPARNRPAGGWPLLTLGSADLLTVCPFLGTCEKAAIGWPCDVEAADAVEAGIVEVGIGAGVHARRLERRFSARHGRQMRRRLVDVRHVDRHGLGAHLLGERRHQCRGRSRRLGEQRPDARGAWQARMTAKPTILPSRNATSEARSGSEIHAARNELRASGKKRRS